MGKFKVGDRVRPKQTSNFLNVAETYEVSGIAPSTNVEWVWLENVRNHYSHDGSFQEDDLELIEPDAATTKNWDFDPRRELKVGDRVRAISDEPKGIEGVVAQLPSDGTILVEFDDFDGHNGSGALSSGCGWWLLRRELELLPPAITPEPDLSVRAVADTSQLDGEIDRILRRLKKVEKKARKLGIRLEFRDAA